jgi:hypothetical protein
MTTNSPQKNRYFCIFDYYLDGVFLKWEEIKGECPILIHGEELVVSLDDGTQITAEIIDTKLISENERHIFLRSL